MRSAAGGPPCTVVFRSSTAGGAYQPGMSEFSIFVRDQAQVFLGGPTLVQMATGEVSTAEELGSADMHTSISGVADALAEDEFEACQMARSWVLSINKVGGDLSSKDRNMLTLGPKYASDELLGLVP